MSRAQWINRPWKPKQTAIKDKKGKILQGKEDVKKRWIDYYSSLYTESANGQSVVTELNRITPPPNEDELHHIQYMATRSTIRSLLMIMIYWRKAGMSCKKI